MKINPTVTHSGYFNMLSMAGCQCNKTAGLRERGFTWCRIIENVSVSDRQSVSSRNDACLIDRDIVVLGDGQYWRANRASLGTAYLYLYSFPMQCCICT